MERIVQILHSDVPGLPALWEFWQGLALSDSNRSFAMYGIVPMIFFYLYGAVLFLVDMTATPAFLERFKVQNGTRPSAKQYWAALKTSLFNWLVLGLPFTYLLTHHVMPALCPTLPPLPTVFVFLRDMLAFVACEEVLFYFSHRTLHHPLLYAPIHKFHHTYTAPFGIAAIYAHPVEHMLSNIIPASAGSVLMRSHPVLPMLWGVLALFNTMTVHSGYDFSSFLIFPSPYFHDWHHEKFNENFGLGLLDYLLGTSKGFRAAIAKGEVYVPRAKKSKKTA